MFERDIAAVVVVVVSLAFLCRANCRLAVTTPNWTAAVATIPLAPSICAGLVLLTSRVSVAAIATDLATWAFVRLWTSRRSAPHASSGTAAGQPTGPQPPAPAIRQRAITRYFLILPAALALYLDLDGQATQRFLAVSAILIESPGWAVAMGSLLIVFGVICKSEPTWRQLAHASACALWFFCALLLLSLRPAFSGLTTLTLICGLVAISRVQGKYLRNYLHAYDLIYFLRNPAACLFFIRTLPAVAIPGLCITAGVVALVTIVGLIEPAIVDRVHAFSAFVIAALAFVISRAFVKPRSFGSHFVDSAHVSNFIDSIAEAVGAYWRGGVLLTSPSGANGTALPLAPAILPQQRRSPQIIVILNESTFPPWIYSAVESEPSLDAFFRSGDGRCRELRVETFGGISWATEFSLLTGIPASSYGPFRPHVFRWATGRLKHSLPYCMRQQGYRTAVIYPNRQEFVGAGAFYRSIGFQEILDQTVLGTMRDRERDRFYHDGAVSWLERHFASTDAPAFVFVLTMSNHSPHNCRLSVLDEDVDQRYVQGSSEFEEYMRRLRLSGADYARFRAELSRRFPDREFLILHFGDHQPSFTLQMLETKRAWRSVMGEFPTEEIAYRTYFALDGVNFQPRIDAGLPDVLEIGYLGTVMLAAAGLPLDPVHTLRHQLMQRHSGRLFFADADGTIAGQLNQHLIDAALITPH